MATNGWAAATYTFSSDNYFSIANFSSCDSGPCANYTASMSLTGSFTLASALPPNFSGGADITSQVTAYSFSDGVNTYASTNPNSRIYNFAVVTDGSGNITIGNILLELWQSGSSPHAVGNRVAFIYLNGPAFPNGPALPTINQGHNNRICIAVANSAPSGVSDVCQTASLDASTSVASARFGSFAGGGGGPIPTTTAIISTLNPSVVGQSVTFTATVTPGNPTGAVQFKDGPFNLGAAVALSGGSAALTTAALAQGTHSITAAYGGDANNAASASPAVVQTVTSVGPPLNRANPFRRFRSWG